jgi:hypothetical protein
MKGKLTTGRNEKRSQSEEGMEKRIESRASRRHVDGANKERDNAYKTKGQMSVQAKTRK